MKRFLIILNLVIWSIVAVEARAERTDYPVASYEECRSQAAYLANRGQKVTTSITGYRQAVIQFENGLNFFSIGCGDSVMIVNKFNTKEMIAAYEQQANVEKIKAYQKAQALGIK